MRPLDPRIAPHLRPARRALSGVLAGGGVGGLLVVAQAFALGTMIVRLVDGGAGAWRSAAVWLAAIVVARACAAYVVDRASAAAAAQVTVPLRRRLLESTLALDAESLTRHRTGELTLLLTRGLASIEPYLTRYLPTLVLAAILPPVTLVTIFWLDWRSGLVVLLTLPLIPVFAILIGLATRDRAASQWRALSALSGHFLDVVRGLPTLVAFRRAGAQAASIRTITDRYRRASVETLRIAFASSAVLELVATISVALVAVTVGLRLASGSLDFRTALIVLLLAPEAYWPLRRVGAEYHAAAEGTAAFETASALLTPTRRKLTADPSQSDALSTDGVSRPGDNALLGDGSAEGVTLGYDGREVPAVESLDARFPFPGLTAIVGPSGCGKTTLLSALVGELTPREGRISIGGLDLADVDPDDWHGRLAWSPQRPWLTAGSLAANLRIADPDATGDALWAALDRVALGDDVRSLPGGLDHQLAEDGGGLSAGQRARLALARVVLAERPYVFLDEPTAHLDSLTEQVLLDTLRDLAKTSCVVVVAHRPAVVDAADHVVTLPAAASPGPPSTSTSEDDLAPVAPRQALGRSGEPPAPPRFGARTGTLLGTLSLASGVALTATAAWLITRASEHPPVLVLMVAIVGVRTFGLARPVLRYAERLVSHDAALHLLAERRAQVYDALVPLVPARLGRRRGDVLTSIVDDVDSLVDLQLRVRQPAWTAAWVGLAAAVGAGLIDPVAGLVVLGVVLVGGLGGVVARRGVAGAEPAFVASRAGLSARIEEVLHGARQLVVWGAADDALRTIDGAGRALGRVTSASSRAVARGRALALLAAGLGTVALAAVLPPDNLSAALTALIVMLPVALLDAFAPLADAGALSVRTEAALRRLSDLEAAQPVVTDPPHPVEAPDPHSALALAAVTAGWGSSDAVRDLSLTLAPGSRVGLVGVSGSGKSTVAALLLRFLDPREGRVCRDGVDLRTLALDDVRRDTGLVDDDPHVFGSTLVENVRLARPEASDVEVRAALDAARLGPWVESLPQGLHTHVGEGHAHVSGGERARLGIARVLLADPPVLVLDEPTAHLDAATAQAVADEVLHALPDRAVLWITHGTVGLDAMDTVVTLPDHTRAEPRVPAEAGARI
jgi:ATP-binding cassette, subfamily C, bacterial CydCD